jgi:hypothetical protein
LNFYLQVLEYINGIIKKNCNNKLVIISIIQNALMRVCAVSMFCEDSNICKRITKEIIKTLVDQSLCNDDIK